MPVIMPCEKCRRRLRVVERLLGKMIRCPACRHKFLAPELEDAAPVGTSAAAAMAPVAAHPGRAHQPRLAARPVHAIEAGPPPEELAQEPAEDGLATIAAGAPADDFGESARQAAKRAARPRQSSFLSVFLTLGVILLLTAALGAASAYWVYAGVQSLQGRPGIPQQRHSRG